MYTINGRSPEILPGKLTYSYLTGGRSPLVLTKRGTPEPAATAARIPKGANRGLYAGKTIMHSHKVTFSNKKSKRMWHPNVQKKTYYSTILGVHLKIRMTTAAMRWIDKAGGFDSYIYHTPDHKLASELGVILKTRMHSIVKNHPDNISPPPRVRRVQNRPHTLEGSEIGSSASREASTEHIPKSQEH